MQTEVSATGAGLSKVPADGAGRQGDGALLQASRCGDDRAFGLFAQRHGRRIYNVAWRLTNDRHLAEDISQEVLVTALRRGEPDAEDLAGWLHVVTRNLAINACRSRQRRRIVVRLGMPTAAGRADDPSADVARRERSQAVRAAIAELPEPQRAALVLAKYEGLSADQISEILGCTRDAVKMRVSRAIGTLRRTLAKELADGDATS